MAPDSTPGRRYQSRYSQPAVSAARIAPPHISIIQKRGRNRLRGDQVAVAKFPGKPAAKPTIIPMARAVFGPAPQVVRTEAYRAEMKPERTKSVAIHTTGKAE